MGGSCHDDAADFDCGSTGNRLVVSPNRVTTDLGRAIKMHCLRQPGMTQVILARESGVPLARIRKFVENDPDNTPRPRLDEALSIWAVLGKAAANASMSAIGMIAEDAEAETARLRVMVADASTAFSTLAHIAIDDEVGASEADDAIRAAEQMIETGYKLRLVGEQAKRR